MKHLFVPYEIALLAKKNGFNEPSFGVFVEQTWGNGDIRFLLEGEVMDDNEEILFPAPLYQQLIDWFRINYNLSIGIDTYNDIMRDTITYTPYFKMDHINKKIWDNSFIQSKSYEIAINKALLIAFKIVFDKYIPQNGINITQISE